MKFRFFFFLFLLAAGSSGIEFSIPGKGGRMSAEYSAWVDKTHAGIPDPEPADLEPKEAGTAEILAALFPEDEELLEESA